jgi:general stress protein 26
MNTISRNQDDPSLKNLFGKEAVAKMRSLIDSSGSTCFFRTEITIHANHTARPMSVQKTDEEGNLWFLSALDSTKNIELTTSPDASLFFQGTGHADFMELQGHVIITKDKHKIEELWDPIVKNWFEGKDDPRITVMQFIPDYGYYWDNKHGNAVAGVKLLLGAMVGKKMDDSVEGRLAY